MKPLAIISILLLLIACSEREIYDNSSGTQVNGLFTEIKGKVLGELKLDKSPYRITDDLVVDSNTTLIIKPGVKLFFDKNKKMIVKGELKAIGNYYQEIVFAAYNSSLKWSGIKFYSADKPAKFNFVTIKDIRQEVDSSEILSSISISNSNAEFIHTTFSNNSAIHGGAVGLFNSTLSLKNCIIRDNNADVIGGAIISQGSDIQIINNTFYKNSSFNSCGGVFVYEPVKTELQNNIFYKHQSNSGDINFIYISSDSSTLINQYNYFAVGNMDPLFLDINYLTLYYLSPCKDAGNPDTIFNDYNGTRNDQGAYGGPLGNW